MPHLFPPTKGESRWRAAGYLMISGVGFYTLFGPDTYGARLGPLAPWVYVWVLFMLTSVPTAVSVLQGKYRLEAILLPLFGAALLAAVGNAVWRIFDGEPELLPRIFMPMAVLCFLALRGLQLHRVTKAEAWISTSTGS